MNFHPIGNDSVVKTILKEIKDSIVRGELKPGDKVPTEMELSTQLGVGRNSVREAIKMLCAMGILEVRRGQGTYVTSTVSPEVFNPLIFNMVLIPKKSEDVYELRIMFEGMVTLILMDKVSEETIEPIWRYLEDIEKIMESGEKDAEFFVQSDLYFHRQLLKATGNPLVELIGQTVAELFVDLIRKSLSTVGGVEDSLRNHRSILSLIRDKNRNAVFQVIAKTLSRWRQQLPGRADE